MGDLKKDYGVFGDRGYVTEELLFESNSVNEAIEFAEGYTKTGNMGGYNIIEVAFDLNGSMVTTRTMETESYLYDDEA